MQHNYKIFKRISGVPSVFYKNTCLSQEFHNRKTNIGKGEVVKCILCALYLPCGFYFKICSSDIFCTLSFVVIWFLKENANWDFLNNELLESGGLKKMSTVRVDNCALGSRQLIWKVALAAKIWLQPFRLET